MKTTIRRKLLVSIITLLTLLYIITGAITGLYVHSLLLKQADRDNRQVLMQAMQQLDVILQMSEMTARQVMTDEDLRSIDRSTREEQQAQRYVVLSRANTLLSGYTALNPFVANIVVFLPEDRTLSNQGVLLSDHFRGREKMAWYVNFVGGASRSCISDEHETMALGSMQKVVTLAYKFRMLPDDARQENILMIDIPTSMFRDLLQSGGAYPNILVTNDGEQPLVSSPMLGPEDLRGHTNSHGVFHLPDTIALYERMDSVGWNLYYPIPRSEFNRPIALLLTGFAGLYVLVLLVSLLLLSRRIRFLVAPVHRITSTMQAAYKGNLTVSTDEHSGDEFEILSDCFNKLLEDLRRHIQQILQEEHAMKEMQLDLMMSQIHPHFIYNTLHSVVYLIEEGRGEVAIDTVYSLITLLQSVVRLGDKEVFATLGEEIALLKAYAEIASVRYPGMFHLEIHCESPLQCQRVPKVLIQPLVENAIQHGILPSGRVGHVWVRIASWRHGQVEIRVEDDGVGIDAQSLDALWNPEQGKSIHGIGLANIRNRIQFLYPAADSAFAQRPHMVY